MIKYVVTQHSMLLEKSSISDTIEKHTMEMMKKLEGHMPLHLKSFSDFSREYMKLLEQTFKINCSIEKKIFGNMGADEKAIRILDDYLEGTSRFYSSQIDMATEFFKGYLNMRLILMESYNKFVQDFASQVRPEKIDAESKTA